MKKRVFVLGMMLALLIGTMQPLAAYAQEPFTAPVFEDEIALLPAGRGGIVSPLWNNAASASCGISKSGTTVIANLYIGANNSSFHTGGTLYIEKYSNASWAVVATYGINQYGTVSKSFGYAATPGFYYRVRYSGTTGGESIDISSNTMWL